MKFWRKTPKALLHSSYKVVKIVLVNMGYLKSVYIHESSSTAETREINHANFGLFGEPHLTKKQVYFLFNNLHHANTKQHSVSISSTG